MARPRKIRTGRYSRSRSSKAALPSFSRRFRHPARTRRNPLRLICRNAQRQPKHRTAAARPGPASVARFAASASRTERARSARDRREPWPEGMAGISILPFCRRSAAPISPLPQHRGVRSAPATDRGTRLASTPTVTAASRHPARAPGGRRAQRPASRRSRRWRRRRATALDKDEDDAELVHPIPRPLERPP